MIVPNPDDPESWVDRTLTLEVNDGFRWTPHIYACVEPSDPNGPQLPKYTVSIPAESVPPGLRQHLHVSDWEHVSASLRIRPRVWTCDDSDESYDRLDKALRRLEVQNRPLDEVFMALAVKVTVKVSVWPRRYGANPRAPLFLGLMSIAVDI